MTLTGTATSQISVSGIRVNPANVEWDSSLYRGPAFRELDPDLQVGGPKNVLEFIHPIACSLVLTYHLGFAVILSCYAPWMFVCP